MKKEITENQKCWQDCRKSDVDINMCMWFELQTVWRMNQSKPSIYLYVLYMPCYTVCSIALLVVVAAVHRSKPFIFHSSPLTVHANRILRVLQLASYCWIATMCILLHWSATFGSTVQYNVEFIHKPDRREKWRMKQEKSTTYCITLHCIELNEIHLICETMTDIYGFISVFLGLIAPAQEKTTNPYLCQIQKFINRWTYFLGLMPSDGSFVWKIVDTLSISLYLFLSLSPHSMLWARNVCWKLDHLIVTKSLLPHIDSNAKHLATQLCIQ